MAFLLMIPVHNARLIPLDVSPKRDNRAYRVPGAKPYSSARHDKAQGRPSH